ncbi:MAG: hypothetical protein V1804_04430 [Patescibacteria group bacterium]
MFQQVVSSLIFLLVIPFLYVKIVLRKNLSDFGIQKGERATGLAWSIISIVVAFLILYLFIQYFNFLNKYNLPGTVQKSFTLFIGYEVFLVGFFVALYEIFFRGFVMFTFSGKLGHWSVLLQGIAFFLLIWLSGSLNWTMAPYIMLAFLSGITAFYSRSIIYSFALSLFFMILVDSIFIKLAK